MKTIRKILITVMATLLCISVIALVGCGSRHTHTYATKWDSDNNYHWHSDTCGHNTMSEKASHTFGAWRIVKQATISESGLKSRLCTVCLYSEDEEIAKIIPEVYKITYDLKGGAFLSSAVTSYTYGTGIDALPGKNDIKKHGYVFDGWKDNTDRILTEISNMREGDVKLVAQWTPIEYLATFKAEGNTVGTAKFTLDDSQIKNIPTVPTKTGYTGKWENYNLTANNIIINAVYSKVNYKITYSNTKGVSTPNKHSYTIEDDTIVLSSLNKDGYIFDGWDNGSTKVESIAQGSYGDKTLTAKWTLIEYTATFKVDGEIIGTEKFTVEDSSINAPDIPQKIGYTSKWEN